MDKNIKYEICKHKPTGLWVLWKTEEFQDEEKGIGGVSLKKIISGTKKDCQEELKRIKANRTA